MKRVLSRIMLVFSFVCVTTVFVSAQPASAANIGNGLCDAGEFCVWEHSHYVGTGCFRDWGSGTTDGDYTNGTPAWNYGPSYCFNGYSMNDRISSYKNRAFAGEWIVFGRNSGNGTQPYNFCAAAGASSPYLQNFGGLTWNPNDSFSSHYTTFGSPTRCFYTDRD